MKTIICGPPHSGKSVLIANLQKLMPTDSFQRITANGDGEGAWSNNPNQEEVMSVRVKTNNTPEEFAFWTKLIKTAQQDIVLVDIGGRIQEDKIPLFEASDSFIIVCSRFMLEKEHDIIDRWKALGEECGCECIGIVMTVLGGKDELYSTDSYFYGQLSDMERGKYNLDSPVLKALAETIIVKSNYTPIINFNEIAHRLGTSLTWKTNNGIKVERSYIPYANASALFQILQDEYKDIGYAKLVGADTNITAAIAADCLCGDTPERISLYDYWTNSFIALAKLDKSTCPNEYNNGLTVNVIETETTVTLKYKIPDLGIDTAHYQQYQLPIIDESKFLFISGRFPNWFMASLVINYKSPEVHLHVPGKGYICVRSQIKENLGSLYTK